MGIVSRVGVASHANGDEDEVEMKNPIKCSTPGCFHEAQVVYVAPSGKKKTKMCYACSRLFLRMGGGSEESLEGDPP